MDHRIQCAACLNYVSQHTTVQAPCKDHYCRECIIEFVRACTRDESVFPLRCCNQPIPQNSIFPILPPSLQSFFQSKRLELGIKAVYRIYCPTADCSSFLGSSEGAEGTISCHKCHSAVCAACKQAAHAGETCSGNAAIQEVRALARDKHWQTCPGCHAIVELHQGCYHMICRCLAQFCYLCGIPWKQCTCPQWDENHIIEGGGEAVLMIDIDMQENI